MKKILFENIELYVQKNRKARYIKLRINHKSEAVLVVPWLCSERQALEFARGHIDWIKKHQQTKSDDVKFEHGQKIELMGQELLIQNHPTARRGVWIEGDILYVSGDPAFSNRRITEFIKKAIYAYIQEKALHLAGKIGQRPNRISLKDTTSRWGSCSSQKNLNFSWKLALAPKFVLDYIIAHEVAHLAEMNHGPHFWATVAKIDDNRANAEIWLRRHGRGLHSFG